MDRVALIIKQKNPMRRVICLFCYVFVCFIMFLFVLSMVLFCNCINSSTDSFRPYPH
jgi:hypothetical protein